MTNLYISISPREAAKKIHDTIINDSVTGELIDEYVITADSDKVTIVQVYEKFYLRAENRLTLTIVIDNVTGKTHIHAISGGGGVLFRCDGGASNDFEQSIYDAVYKYITEYK
jgi:hypothetical protein